MVSPLKLILGQLTCVATVKLGANFVVIPNISSYFCSSFSHVYSSLSGYDSDFFSLLGLISFSISHFCSKGRMTVLCIGVGTGHKSDERDLPEASPKPSLKEKYRMNCRPFA